MQQIIQNMKTGETVLEDIPAPSIKAGHVLIQTTRSLVSLGTERMLVEFGKANLVEKAKQQPDKVKQVLGKMKSEGIFPTLEAVFNKLDAPLPLGYCNVGKVIEVGEGVTEFKIGDRVASNGNHAEIVCVAKNLVAHIPNNVSDDEAAFTVVGSIGLQGIRLAKPELGETVVITGLGLIGLMTAQLLKANGCQVIGTDFDSQKVDLARSWGIEAVDLSEGMDPVKYVNTTTGGKGADAVIITASAKSDEIISQSANMSRKRGRIILVGVVGLNLNRSEFYKKELTFQVSCSYGAGRYDDEYEQKGNDYPLPYVRWTENRNFLTILNAISSKKIDVNPLISEVISLDDYQSIYGNMRKSGVIASILRYPEKANRSSVVSVNNNSFTKRNGVMAIVGAGNFTQMTMLPILKKVGVALKYIVSANGFSGTSLAKKYGIGNSSTDLNTVLSDEDVDTIIITTRHNLHADMVIRSLQAGKNVFVEKPLALNEKELDAISEAYQTSNATLTVGFNRRFAPFSEKIASSLDGQSPINIIATMNAGAIPADVWVHDMNTGGGRIIGEACHFIDLLSFFVGSKVKSVFMSGMGVNPTANCDNAIITLKYENGSQGVINYFANGSKAYSKERIEIYSQDRTYVIDNWRKLTAFGVKGMKNDSSKIDKGHFNQFMEFNRRIKQGGDALISFEEIYNTTKVSFAAIKSLQSGMVIKI